MAQQSCLITKKRHSFDSLEISSLAIKSKMPGPFKICNIVKLAAFIPGHIFPTQQTNFNVSKSHKCFAF